MRKSTFFDAHFFFFFILSIHILLLSKFPWNFPSRFFVPFRLFISFSYVIFPRLSNNNQISVYRIREIGMELLENKDFRNGRCPRSLFFFFYFKDQDEFYTRWIVLKWNKFVIDKKKKAIMLEERRKWETLIVIKLVLRNWLVY